MNPTGKDGNPDNFIKARDEHTACVLGERMIIYGGFKEGERCSDIFAYDFKQNTWECIKPINGSPVPPPTAGHSAILAKCPDTGADTMIIFGGKDDENAKVNDLWKYDFNLNCW